MINYELAKELKDAGFPFDDKVLDEFTDGKTLYQITRWKPTLSELIYACGERLFSIEQDQPMYWIVKGDTEVSHYGINPETAVAHLWLSLNKK